MAKTIRFAGAGHSTDGTKVFIRSHDENGEEVINWAAVEDVPNLIVLLLKANSDAARINGWKQTPIAGTDDSGVWLQPTQAGLTHGTGPLADKVCLIVGVGPTRLRFALTKMAANELARTLATAACATDSQRPN